MNDPYFEFAKSLLVPLATIVFGAAAAAFQEWRVRRSETGRRKLTLEDARAQVAFVSEWWQANKALGLPPSAEKDLEQRAEAWLSEASERVAAYPLPELQTDLPGVWRRVFLAYPLQSPGARVARVAFYLLIGWTPIVLGAAVSNRSFVPGYATLDLLIAVGAVVLGGTLRALAIAIERHDSRRAAAGGPDQGLFQTAFLVHRLEAPSARRGRLVMYVLLVALPAYLINYLVFLDRRPSEGRQYLPLTMGGFLSLVTAAVGVRSWTAYLERRYSGTITTDTTTADMTTADMTTADPSATPQAVTP